MAVRRLRVPLSRSLFGGRRSRGRRPKIVGGLRGFGDVDDGSLPCPTGSGMCPPFNSTVEQWRDDVKGYAPDLPTDFLCAWIQIESQGSVCSDTSYAEVGIFQLMPPDNIARGNTTVAQQHPVPPCSTGSSSYVWRSQVSDDIAHDQVQGGIDYVRYCITYAEAQLSALGYLNQPGWSSSDWSYWAMVKMVHVAPAPIMGMLTRGMSGGAIPADWDEMIANGGGTGVPASWIANARAVGIFGQGGGTIVSTITNTLTSTRGLFMIGLGVGALALLYLAKKNRYISV